MMPMTDRGILMADQYRDAGKLNARVALHARYSTNPQGWFPWLFDRLEIGPDARILELGCGAGALWLENWQRVPPGWRVALSDLSSVRPLSPAPKNACAPEGPSISPRIPVSSQPGRPTPSRVAPAPAIPGAEAQTGPHKPIRPRVAPRVSHPSATRPRR